MQPKRYGKQIGLIISLIVLLGLIFIPIPYYIEQPGATINLAKLITVNQKVDKQTGSFSLTSVGVQQATPMTALLAKCSSFKEVVSAHELMGKATGEEYNQMQNYYMKSAQNNAKEQALRLAGMPFQMTYKGVYILSVEKQSSFYGKIQVGDTITGIDGQKFENSQAFMKYVQSKKVSEQVEITYLHHNQPAVAKGALIELPSNKKAGIGISLVDHTEITSDQTIDFHIENIGGPSAGLMFTLEIYQQLTGKNLRKGQMIAGTGTIESDGTVGRIGGIDKKIASASKAGATIFFAPDDTITKEDQQTDSSIQSNYQEAKKAAKSLQTTMKIVPVKTVQDAIRYLEMEK